MSLSSSKRCHSAIWPLMSHYASKINTWGQLPSPPRTTAHSRPRASGTNTARHRCRGAATPTPRAAQWEARTTGNRPYRPLAAGAVRWRSAWNSPDLRCSPSPHLRPWLRTHPATRVGQAAVVGTAAVPRSRTVQAAGLPGAFGTPGNASATGPGARIRPAVPPAAARRQTAASRKTASRQPHPRQPRPPFGQPPALGKRPGSRFPRGTGNFLTTAQTPAIAAPGQMGIQFSLRLVQLFHCRSRHVGAAHPFFCALSAHATG